MQAEMNNNSNATPEGEEKPLCCRCMFPNENSENFCANCGAPLSWFSTIGPFESAYSEGYLIRMATENPHSLLVLIGVWLIFFPLLFIGLGLIFSKDLRELWNPVLGVIIFLLSGAILYKITRNYFKSVKINKINNHQAEN